jgi:serine/threonine-protein kinase
MGPFRGGVRRRIALLALAATTSLSAPTARAQSGPGSPTLAVTLFKRGRQLMQEKRYAEACPLFAESYKLDPSGGTLTNLAFCHELEGRYATAEAEYQDLIGRSRHQNRTDRVRFAEERLAGVARKVPHWTITLGANQQLPGLEVLHDGQPVPAALWGGGMVPTDPDKHEIEVRATNHTPWRDSYVVAPGELAKIVVPPLAPVQSAPTPPPPPADSSPPPPIVIVEATPEPAPPVEPPRRPRRSAQGRAVAGAVFGGVGVLGLGAGTYFGLTAFALRDDVKSLCPSSCSGDKRERADDANQRGKLNAHLSTASFGVGALGLGLGAYFLFLAPSSSPSPPAGRAGVTLHVVPHVASGAPGLSVAGVW